jgi:hypothetical protein
MRPRASQFAAPEPHRPCACTGGWQLFLNKTFMVLPVPGHHQLHETRPSIWHSSGVALNGSIRNAFGMHIPGALGKAEAVVHQVHVVQPVNCVPLWMTQCGKWCGRCCDTVARRPTPSANWRRHRSRSRACQAVPASGPGWAGGPHERHGVDALCRVAPGLGMRIVLGS